MRKITTHAHTPTEFSIENISDNKAKICAWPFEIGYGITLAHPLRRLLYASTLGYAPVGLKIEGIAHEFDSMRGMLEDVTLFIINLKKMRFKLKGSNDRELIKYSFSGAKELYGKDLCNEQVELVNADEYLVTINEDAKLDFTIIVDKGIGYVPSEETRLTLDPDYIALDAFFSPVKMVTYDIENVLFEDNPDYEKVTFEISTDGQISPKDAFKNALNAIYKQLSVFDKINLSNLGKNEQKPKEFADAKLLQNITELSLSARSYNSLEKANIQYIGELVLMSVAQLGELKNLGKKSLDEIKSIMEELGYPIGNSELDDDAKKALEEKIHKLKGNK